MVRRRLIAHLSLVLAVAALALGAMPPASAAAELEPYLYVRDAPFVRSNVVDLGFVIGSAGPVIARVASNDPSMTDGVLTNGVSVPESGPWTLADGPDGARTVYGQVQLANGQWSEVMSLSLVLDTSPQSSFYADRDPSSLIDPGVHRYVTSADTNFIGIAQPAGPQDQSRFQVLGPDMELTMHTPGAPITPGVYEAVVDGNGACGSICVDVRTGDMGCLATGTVTVHEISFHASGDLEAVAADYRLTCLPGLVFSGAVRYGSNRNVVALGQDVDGLSFASLVVGEASDAQAITFTNIGTLPNTFGTAGLTAAPAGDASTDYHITDDQCSGETLSVGESCDLSLVFEPTARGLRHAWLEIPDETSRGGRLVKLGGSATQSTTTQLIAQDVPEFGPEAATFDVVVSPAGPGYARLYVDGIAQVGATEQTLEDPSRTVTRYVITLQPGQHEVSADFEGIDFMLDSTAEPLDVQVGVETTLELSTSTDDGVAAGEVAELKAKLWSGGPVSGTLRIRDGLTNAILASSAVSTDDPSLVHSVIRGQGTHAFMAEFVPASSAFESATDTYDLEVVNGPRPETEMSSAPLYSAYWVVEGTFSTPTVGASLECRQGAQSNLWFACTSPHTWVWNQAGVVELFVRARLPNGLADRTPASRLWYIDTVAPTATAPTRAFVTGSSISSGRITTRIGWSGSDATSGIARYELAQSTDGGAWATVSTSLTKASLDRALATQHSYRFRVRPVDRAGNVGAWATGATFTVSRYSEGNSRIRYSGTWRTASSSAYWGGVAKYATAAGARATFTSTGRSIAWVSRRGPTRGKAQIYVNGTRVATIDLYASSWQNQRVVWSTSWSSAATRTISIRVVGTSGRPRVDMDALVTGS